MKQSCSHLLNPSRLFLFEAPNHRLHELWAESDLYLFAYALAADGRSAAVITSTSPLGDHEGVETIQLLDTQNGQVTPLAVGHHQPAND